MIRARVVRVPSGYVDKPLSGWNEGARKDKLGRSESVGM